LQTQPAGSRRRVFLLWRVQIALKPAGVFMRDKGLKFVIADSAFKRKQVDARACWLDTGEHHPGLAFRTSGARNCSEWNGGRKALRLGHDAFPRIGGSATLSARWFELTTKGRPRTRRPNLAGFSLLFAGGGLLLLTRRIAMLLGNSRKSGGPPLLALSFKVKRDVHSQRSGLVVAPGLKGLNAHGPLKVHPKMASSSLRRVVAR